MIGTSEVRVRYEKVIELIRCLNKYHKALGNMKKSITAIREVYKEGKGKTMESLVMESDILIKYIDGLEQDVSDLVTIFDKYMTDTTAIIKPERRDVVMKIDRNDILQKKDSIISTCSKIPSIHSDVSIAYFDDWLLWGEDEEERELELGRRARNDGKLDSIKYKIRATEKEITSLIDKVNGVYNGVKNYEDKDQQFAREAKKLVPSPVEKRDDAKGKIGEQLIHFGEGLFDSIADLVKGLADSAVGIIKYDASFFTYLYGELSGNEIPKWADDYCYNTSVETNEKIKAVLDDPMIVVDGIKNGIRDTYEEKGGAYCGGYAIGLIGTTLAGTKGMDKLAKIGKGGKAARALEELGYVDETMATVSKASDVAMDVVANGSKVITKIAGGAEAGEMVATVGDDLAKLAEEVKTVTKVADKAEDLTKVAGKVKQVTKADELIEASKALADGGEAAGKGGVVEEVVSKGGSGGKPNQVHHYATNKSKTYTQQFEDIMKKYGVDLDGDWNKELLPHQGRHPNDYHEFVLNELRNIDNIANGDVDIFLELYESNVKSIIRENPDMLYKAFWINQ